MVRRQKLGSQDHDRQNKLQNGLWSKHGQERRKPRNESICLITEVGLTDTRRKIKVCMT